jgi:hypothetical protein
VRVARRQARGGELVESVDAPHRVDRDGPVVVERVAAGDDDDAGPVRGERLARVALLGERADGTAEQRRG